MMEKNAFLVVGGDSLVGGGLLHALRSRGAKAYGSTRRKDTLDEGRVYLNFETPDDFVAPADAGYAYIVAAATNYDRCEKDPLAYTTNVELTPRLIGSLLRQGLFVTFISTNSVFGGERPWPGEDDPHAPGIAYAIQKHEAEAKVNAMAKELGAQDRLNTVRLTKILDRSTSPLPAWFASWERGEAVTPFEDLVFAPMSLKFVGEALATLGEKRIPGNLHLSGAENISYVAFAKVLAEKMGVDASLIAPTTATARGVHIAFKPTYSGLGMQRTTALSGVAPQTIQDVVADLLAVENA